MRNCRITPQLVTGLFVIQLFALVRSLLAQPPLDLSPVQAQLEGAIDNLEAGRIREALQAGADPNYRYGKRGRSVLGTVGLYGRVTPETEERLIASYDALFKAGARLRAYDQDILHGPAITGSARVTKYLLERGADPNGKDSDGNTPVILATKYGHADVVAVLVASGATPLDPTMEAQIRMIASARRGDLGGLRNELTRGAEINGRDATGETALVEAIRDGTLRDGNVIIVRELLKLGANPNLPGRFIGGGSSSPLHAAVFSNEKNFQRDNGPAVVDALLKAGAHVSSVDFHRKQTPLHLASQMQNTKAAILLLRAGAKVMPRDEDGKTPLDLAEASAMIKLLKAHGAKEQ